MIRKLLVANRGEIARRIFRTCREMGVGTVAVFSDPDAVEPHVAESDEAVRLPGAAPADTYLDISSLLSAAESTGADAVHPGYGFLSENAGFAQAVVDAGLIWVGPPPEAIAAMGSKLEARRIMTAAGVPVLPAVDLSGMTPKETTAAAAAIGYPVLVKASAGGGGKGMRVVSDPSLLGEATEGARREAKSAFADDTMFLEKYLETARHIEIQVVADTHGLVASLHERECSIQRRHQKIIEEAPSPALGERERTAMGATAVAAAKAVGYVGAGTVEFLFQDGEFWFLEMNTRLQVEHPVTEMVTGLDLVRLQLEIAAGSPLPPHAVTPILNGHAIEARLYAEDPGNDFLPVTGPVHRFEFPHLPGLRVDSGVEAGSVVSVHYDPLLAKIVAHGPNREEAATTLATALRRARLHTGTTNRALLVRTLEHPEFRAGRTDTGFLARHRAEALSAPLLGPDQEHQAAVAAAVADQAQARAEAAVLATLPSGWRNTPGPMQRRSYQGEHGRYDIDYRIGVTGIETPAGVLEATPERVTLEGSDQFLVARYGDLRFVDSPAGPARLTVLPRLPEPVVEEAPGSLHSPMPGRVIRVEVAVGDMIESGQTLVVLEAMKMEHTIRAPGPGRVTAVNAAPGDQVGAEAVLVVVEQA